MNKLLVKYKTLSPAVKASLWFTVSNFLQRGISMLTTPIFTRVLSTEDFGMVSLYQSWNNLFIVLATLNLSGGVFNNGMVKFKEDRDNFTSSLLGLTTAITLVLCLFVNLFSEAVTKLTSLPIYILNAMMVAYIFIPAQQFWTVEKRFEFNYKPVIFVTFLNVLLTPTVSLLAIFQSSKPGEARILSIIAIQILLGVALYVVLAKRKRVGFNKEYWLYALKFNIPLIPHYLSNYILTSSDRVMIEKMCGVSSTALYSLGFTLATVMYLVTSAINNSFIPWTYQRLKNEDYRSIRRTANQLILLIAATCVCLMIFAPEIIWFLGSQKYAMAVYVVPPIAASVLFTFIYSLFGNVQFYFENTGKVAVASTITACCNIVLNFVFIQIFGYVAAAYTSLFCYILYATLHYRFMKRECIRRSIREEIYDIRFIVKSAVVMFLIIVVSTISYSNVVIRLMMLLAVVVLMIKKKSMIVQMLREIRK